jgi:hypothetical protein
MVQFIFSFIDTLAKQYGNLGLGIAVFAFVIRALLAIPLNEFYKSINKFKAMQPFSDELMEKYYEEDDKRNELFAKMLLNNRCSMLGSIYTSLIGVFFLVIFFLAFSNSNLYIFNDEAMSAVSRSFSFIKDLSVSLYDIFKQNGFGGVLFASSVLPVTALAFTIGHDRSINKYNLVNQINYYRVYWIITACGLVITGLGYSLFLLIFKLLDLTQAFFTKKFFVINKVVDYNGNLFEIKSDGKYEKIGKAQLPKIK